jgi:ech hydrogenase subunit D
VEKFRTGDYRLVQMSCTKIGEQFEIYYSFEKDYHLESLMMVIEPETMVPSVTGMYGGAFVYENEMHDLFGVQVKGMNVDYHGAFIRTSVPCPFRYPVFRGEGPCQGK